ncbi:MAG: hypothetical protein Udaeo2_31360 [Candidatus Udaeobacter sp.]|nr:MAG: hypothetical protein Udaeo2_31360 [Candidatus Udaeobacter sp.]
MTGAPNAEHEQILRVLGDFVVNFDRFSMTEERKTPEMRAQMTDLERLRHSTSHVLPIVIPSERSSEISQIYDEERKTPEMRTDDGPRARATRLPMRDRNLKIGGRRSSPGHRWKTVFITMSIFHRISPDDFERSRRR